MNLFLVEAAKRTRPFINGLREDHFFLGCCLVGSYLIITVLYNATSGTYPICSTGPGCQFPSAPVLLIGIGTLLLGAGKRLTDLQLVTWHTETSEE